MIVFPLTANMPRLFTAIAEWIACVIYIWPLRKRFGKVKLYIILAGSCAAQIMLQYWAGTLAYELWIPGTVLNIIFMLGVIYLCCRIKIKDAVYWCAHAIITAEVVASIEWQIYGIFVYVGLKNNLINRTLFMVVIFSVLFVAITLLKRRIINKSTGVNATRKEMLIAVIVAVIVYTMSNIGFVIENTAFEESVNSNLFYIRTLVDLCGFCILFIQQNQRHESYLKKELSSINNILAVQYEQYLSYKENNEFINRKCHDLKHQIDIIRTENDEEKRESYLKEMETMIKNFKSDVVTGNSVLDTILTSKNTYCIRHDIDLICIADGTLLSFIDTLDICSIFGNALDNAIECVEKYSDSKKKIIKLNIFSQNSFLVIRIENYCETKVNLKKGFPVTTKEDGVNHGYGLKSIRYVVEKYSGTMTLSEEDNWFIMRILIPM